MSIPFAPASADIEYLRNAVRWASAQREDYWHPAPGKSMPWETVLGVYGAVVVHLGLEIEEVIADELPFPWRTYNDEDRAAINYVRTALGLSRRRS